MEEKKSKCKGKKVVAITLAAAAVGAIGVVIYELYKNPDAFKKLIDDDSDDLDDDFDDDTDEDIENDF